MTEDEADLVETNDWRYMMVQPNLWFVDEPLVVFARTFREGAVLALVTLAALNFLKSVEELHDIAENVAFPEDWTDNE